MLQIGSQNFVRDLNLVLKQDNVSKSNLYFKDAGYLPLAFLFFLSGDINVRKTPESGTNN